jgi:hypothetical protein
MPNNMIDAVPQSADQQKSGRKKHKRHLPRQAYQVLANLAATFANTLRNHPSLQALIRSNARNFCSDLLGIIRAQFPLRRGRPSDPLLDEAYRMVEQGRSVPQVARIQFPDWKGLGQAVRRRRPRPYKHDRESKPESPA